MRGRGNFRCGSDRRQGGLKSQVFYPPPERGEKERRGERRRGERRGVETAGLRCRRLKAEGQGRPDVQTAELQVIKESFHLSVLFRVDSVQDMNSQKIRANTAKICLTNIMLTVHGVCCITVLLSHHQTSHQ